MDVSKHDLMNLSHSQFSQLDAMSSVSRRSNLTMITLQSRMTNASGKKIALPRDPRMKENALRRMNEAQMKEIESHLRKLRNTTDLSYSNADAKEEMKREDGEFPALETAKKMIDQETLMRLIDECKEEEDRISVIGGDEDDSVREQLLKQRMQTEE